MGNLLPEHRNYGSGYARHHFEHPNVTVDR
jgi:hypothetical protein